MRRKDDQHGEAAQAVEHRNVVTLGRHWLSYHLCKRINVNPVPRIS
jgi:hypothetical protein